ncbi:hypothetical protein [Metasolibacillus sp.]|uniref:hypothetical protein n=1 Tax=Metasolibacillus sp. TaxID=2703680 RepID=UPI0025F2AE3F|nr:hypothetical protein [Metasolibacillus sp.]MCT6925406.1 hypothetical protein [Metasolibacillus sp.]MCT6941567.1 hypothetical protein [Metasolibacillus sp.]
MTLYNTQSPITREERNNINATWQDILNRFNNLQRQINILAGDNDVDELIQRITDTVNNADATLADLQTALSDATQLIDDMVAATTSATEAANAANQATADATQLISDMTALQGDLEQLQTSLEQSITDATQATTGAINATTNANQAAQDAQQAKADADNAAQRAESAADAIAGWGQAVPYESGTIYNRNNFVTHEGSTYQAKHDGVTSIPTTTTDWILIARRGLDGQGAVQTVNDQLPDQNGNVDVGIANINGLQGALDAKANNADLTSLEDVVNTHLDNTKMFATAKLPANQSSVNNSETYLALSSLSLSNGADFLVWDGTNNKLKITKSGIYEILLNVHFSPNATGFRYVQPHSASFSVTVNATGGASPTRLQAKFKGTLTTNTLLELVAIQSSGSALDILSISNVVITKVADLS